MAEKHEWNVPDKGASWTADQVVEYLGLVFNDMYDDPEARAKGCPPYVFGPQGAFMAAIKEQIVHAFRMIAQQKPMVVVPGVIKPGGRIQ